MCQKKLRSSDVHTVHVSLDIVMREIIGGASHCMHNWKLKTRKAKPEVQLLNSADQFCSFQKLL